ncbi:hypothetical protein PLICRDRAFT_413911 [Plicaturopsis crispa FD-325 SS-3]|nr:hypothetical protein PLICRDRAFT_413911 [Plicaturopsis crispa FD-325 SS-3]
MPPWNSAKAKVQLRLSVQRLRILQQKKEAQAKSARRDIATLLEKGKVETAKIKVENIINEDIHVELLELLELYCELLTARFALLDQNTREPEPGISEGVCSVIFAALRTEIKELHVLRDLLMHKYGREFAVAVMENRDGCVSERVVKKLSMATPSAELVDAYVAEIARAYGVPWTEPTRAGQESPNDGDGPEGGVKEKARAPPLPADTTPPISPTASITIIDRSKTPKLPDLPPTEDAPATPAKSKPPPAAPVSPEDDFDALAKRFAALKKR